MSAQKNKSEPFLDDVGRYLRDLGQLNNVSVKYDCQGSFHSIKSHIRNSLYRIIREATGNAIRHGNCDTLQVSLKTDAGTVELTVSDNGCGFNPSDYTYGVKSDGLGILNMKELARNIGGSLSIESAPGKGTTVYCRVQRHGSAAP